MSDGDGTWSRRVLVCVAFLGVLLSACSNAEEKGDTDTETSSEASGDSGSSGDVPGVTDDEIRFSVVGTQENNPLGTCVLDCYLDGINAYFAYRNSEGGAFGRDLVVTTALDDQLSQNQVKALEIVTANDTFATFSAAQVGNGWADIAEAGIPLYVWTINPAEMTGKEGIFGNREPICISCTRRADAYIAQLVGAKKVATVGYGISENSKQCAESSAEAIELYADEVDAEVVYTNADLAFGLPNGIGPEVTAMKDAGTELVIGCIDLNGMKTLAQELERQGMDDVVLMHTNTYDHAFVAEAGDLFEGDYVQVGFRPFEAEPNDALAAYQEWMEETGSEPTELAMIGWLNADLAYQGIIAAGEDFDRQKVIDATNEMTEYTADGLLQPIDWSRQHVAPTQEDPATHGSKYECIALVQVQDGEFVMVGDAAKPWSCWPGETRDWSEPERMTFD